MSKDLVGTWFQVSAKFRTVRRLPEGKSGKQALYELTLLNRMQPDPERWVAGMTEQSAGDHYLRTARGMTDEKVLSIEEWAEYKAAGGGTYDGRFQPDLGRVLYELLYPDYNDWAFLDDTTHAYYTHVARTLRLA